MKHHESACLALRDGERACGRTAPDFTVSNPEIAHAGAVQPSAKSVARCFTDPDATPIKRNETVCNPIHHPRAPAPTRGRVALPIAPPNLPLPPTARPNPNRPYPTALRDDPQ